MTKATSPETITTLYRIENPNIPGHQVNDGSSHPDLVGQWFTPNVEETFKHLQKSTQTTGLGAHVVEGAQLVIAQVPGGQLDNYNAYRSPVVAKAKLDIEPDNFLIPRDGSIPTEAVPLDALIGDLSGKLGKFDKRIEAERRIHAKLTELALS